MNRILVIILIIILVLTPIGLIFYFYGGKTITTVPTQIAQSCDQQCIPYYGIKPPIDHITLNIEDNYFYTSFGASKNYLDTHNQYKSYN